MLERAIAKDHFVCLSVCPSLLHNCDPRLNGSRYRHWYSKISYLEIPWTEWWPL